MNLFFLEKFTVVAKENGGNWQSAADLCAATGKVLPIVRSESEVDELCDLVPDTYLWIGVRTGATKNVYLNYLDKSPTPYLKHYLNGGECGSLICQKGGEKVYGKYKGLITWDCSKTHSSIVCENPRKSILFNCFGT